MSSTPPEAPSGRTPSADLSLGERHARIHAERAPELIRRLKSIEGHIRGIQKMVHADAYCIDILKQVKAVKQALERVGAMTLETHLQTCVTEGLRSDDVAERERVIDEIVEVVHATGRL